MFRIHFKAYTNETEAQMKSFNKYLENAKESWERIASKGGVSTVYGTDMSLADMVEQQFESEGAFFGEAWQHLAQVTLDIRKYVGRPWPAFPILTQTKLLRSSFRALHLGKTRFKFGSKVAYARKHQVGKGRVPSRPILIITPAMIRMITGVIIEDALMAYGKGYIDTGKVSVSEHGSTVTGFKDIS